jgi:hypothetical protein
MQSGAIGMVNYGSCLTLQATRDGLYLAVFPLFRIAHPPLFIPWAELHNIKEKRSFFRRVVKMEVGIPRVASVVLPRRVLEARPSVSA